MDAGTVDDPIFRLAPRFKGEFPMHQLPEVLPIAAEEPMAPNLEPVFQEVGKLMTHVREIRIFSLAPATVLFTPTPAAQVTPHPMKLWARAVCPM